VTREAARRIETIYRKENLACRKIKKSNGRSCPSRTGRSGTVTLFLDGEKVGVGRVDATQLLLFSADETTDVGSDSATPVSDDYGPRDSAFTGRVRWVQIDLGEDAEDADHLISPEERLQIAMAWQ
jgi:hypothetical protein